MEKAYAQALWQLVASGMDAKKAVHAMHEKLKADGRGALFQRVGRAFVRLSEREARKRDFVLTVAREKDLADAQKAAKKIIDAYSSEFGTDGANLKTQVDDSLIGGWRLEGNERLVDASYKKRLLDLYNSVTSA